MIRILITTTSFQDTPGSHHDLLREAGYQLICDRGPLSEARMLELVGQIDGLLCGDDAITREVIIKALPRLRVISKYGIGVDKIDIEAASELGIPVAFTPGVNHTTVAEHALMLLLALSKNLVTVANFTASGHWKRITGHEIMGKTIGIVGLGRIGKEMAIRARAFGMKICAHDICWDENFANDNAIERCSDIDELVEKSDVVSLHAFLSTETRGMINAERISRMKKGAIVINCARGELVDTADMVKALTSGKLGGYGADVLDLEPPPVNHPLLGAPNCLITPHIGSRTFESVQRQAGKSVRNLINIIEGRAPEAQVNNVPIKPV